MPASMTGFGRGAVGGKRRRYVVEVRSVNNRYCEVRISAHRDLLEVEHRLSKRVREMFGRGKFDLVLKTERPAGRKKEGIDEKAVTARWRELDRIRKRLKLPHPVPLETALVQTGAGHAHDEPDSEAPRLFLAAAERALAQLRLFREREGKTLAGDIGRRAAGIERSAAKIAAAVKSSRAAKMARMKTRLAQLLKDVNVDSKRLETEVAILIERSDISEEVVRLKSHVARLRQLSASAGHVGREIDFLLQEMNREINTIGSKSTELGIVDEVIFVKSEIEKIREQAQNLE